MAHIGEPVEVIEIELAPEDLPVAEPVEVPAESEPAPALVA